MTLRYDRAWQTQPLTIHTLYDSSDTVCSSCVDEMCNTPSSGLDTNTATSLMAAVTMEIEPDFVMF